MQRDAVMRMVKYHLDKYVALDANEIETMKTQDIIEELECDPNSKTNQKPKLNLKDLFTYKKFNEWEDYGEGDATTPQKTNRKLLGDQDTQKVFN